MTARTSSIRVSRSGRPGGRSESPVPRLSKRIRRAIEPSRSRKRAWPRLLPVLLEVGDEPGDEHEVERAVAGHLVGDVEVAAARVADRRLPRGAARRRQVQARVLAEDAQLELAQRRPGSMPSSLDERPASALEHLQRVGLPAAAVEREHQLAAQALAEHVLGDERLELRHQVVMAAERQVGVDAILERGEPQLVQPGDLALRERLAAEIGQRLAVPQRERIAQARRPLGRIVPRLAPRRPATRTGPGRPRAARDLQQIAGRARPDPIGADQLAQAGDVAVQRGLRGSRRLLPHSASIS